MKKINKQYIDKDIDFDAYLKEELKDPKFKQYYDEYGKQLEIAYTILQLRKKEGISQAELAKKIGTKQSNVARIEAGEQNLTTEMLQKIATALNRSLKIEFAK
mgnify:CR=1 FL=1